MMEYKRCPKCRWKLEQPNKISTRIGKHLMTQLNITNVYGFRYCYNCDYYYSIDPTGKPMVITRIDM